MPEGDKIGKEKRRGRTKEEKVEKEGAEKVSVVDIPDKDLRDLSVPSSTAGPGSVPDSAESMCKGPEAEEYGVKKDSFKEASVTGVQ